MKYKKGDTVIVTKCLHGHKFKIGQKIKIIKIDEINTIKARGMYQYKKDEWYLSPNEIRSIK